MGSETAVRGDGHIEGPAQAAAYEPAYQAGQRFDRGDRTERMRDTVRALVPEHSDGSILLGDQPEAVRRDSLRRRALAWADVVALLAAYGATALFDPPEQSFIHQLVFLLVLPLWVLLNKALRLYDRDANLIHKSTLNELPSIVQSISFGAALMFLLAPVMSVEISRPEIVIFWLSGLSLTVGFRVAARGVVRRSVPAERVLIVGTGVVASLVAQKVSAHPEYGADVVGYVDVTAEGAGSGTVDFLGDVSDFEALCREFRVERVVVAFSSLAHEDLLDVIRVAKRLCVRITIVPRLFEVIGHGVEIDQVEGMTLLGLRGVQRTKSTLWLKRAIDVTAAGAGLLVLAPLLAVVALAVKLTSAGPVLFRQSRVGRGNRTFSILKFRTMVDGADQLKAELRHLNECPDPRLFKMTNDPRVTAVGRFLRRTSLDELPQLINVLRGEMSLVGPRPLVPDENAHVIGWHRARLDLTPGLTGPWQVMGRTAIPFAEMVKLDYLYVADWSLWNDVKLLLRTLPVVLGRSGH